MNPSPQTTIETKSTGDSASKYPHHLFEAWSSKGPRFSC